jgi:retinol dehydrogenase 12
LEGSRVLRQEMFGLWGKKEFSVEDLGNLEGKNVVITGGTSGLGLASAIALAGQGCNVIFSARNEEKGSRTVEHIKSLHASAKVSFGCCDFGDFKSIRDFAKFILDLDIKLDCLMLNAGIALPGLKIVDGIEEMMLVNHLGPYLLANLLFSKIRESAPSRIVFVSSDAHRLVPANPDWEKVFQNEYEGNWEGFVQYGHSKLANIVAANSLNEKLRPDEKVWINSCHPGILLFNSGVVNTDIVQKDPLISSWTGKLVAGMFSFIGTPANNGCLTQCYLAFSKEVEDIGYRGKYFVPNSKLAEPAPTVNDPKSSLELIRISGKYCSSYMDAIPLS